MNEAIITMKTHLQSEGWASRLSQMGYSVKSAHIHKGRISYQIKKDDDAVKVEQSGVVELEVKIPNPTAGQIQILNDIVKIGAAIG